MKNDQHYQHPLFYGVLLNPPTTDQPTNDHLPTDLIIMLKRLENS